MTIMQLDNALGMMVGLAVGDALGAPLEFSPAREPEEYIINYATGGPHNVSVGEYTDDTAMALALADAFIANNGKFNPDDIMQNFLEWRDTGKYGTRDYCFDIGTTTLKAIERYRLDPDNPYKGNSDPAQSGNGALMRIAPAVIAANSYGEAAEYAVAQTILTHGSPECIEYSRIFAMELYGKDALIKYADKKLSVDTPRTDVMSGGYVKETYQAAMWAFQTTDSFADCIITAVNRGHDSDTTGAVAGMLAGAFYGYDNIPQKYIDKLQRHDTIVDMTLKLWKTKKR
jgi:ADP-ribosyl-[dinitrogen reductase] hydrolase